MKIRKTKKKKSNLSNITVDDINQAVDQINAKDSTVSDSKEELHTYTVVDANGKTHVIEAARMSFYGGAVNFFAPKNGDILGKFLSTFTDPISAEETGPTRPVDPDRSGPQFYSVDEVQQGLAETYGGGSESNSNYLFGKIKVRLPYRNVQRYSLDEWTAAARQAEGFASSTWYAKQIEKGVVQVRKNRTYLKHGDS